MTQAGLRALQRSTGLPKTSPLSTWNGCVPHQWGQWQGHWTPLLYARPGVSVQPLPFRPHKQILYEGCGLRSRERGSQGRQGPLRGRIANGPCLHWESPRKKRRNRGHSLNATSSADGPRAKPNSVTDTQVGTLPGWSTEEPWRSIGAQLLDCSPAGGCPIRTGTWLLPEKQFSRAEGGEGGQSTALLGPQRLPDPSTKPGNNQRIQTPQKNGHFAPFDAKFALTIFRKWRKWLPRTQVPSFQTPTLGGKPKALSETMRRVVGVRMVSAFLPAPKSGDRSPLPSRHPSRSGTSTPQGQHNSPTPLPLAQDHKSTLSSQRHHSRAELPCGKKTASPDLFLH